MEISCRHCQAKINIPDHKLPKDKPASFRCPRCSKKITIRPQPPAGGMTPAAEPETSFDFLAGHENTALVCTNDTLADASVQNALFTMEYHITTSHNADHALSIMSYHTFGIVVVDDDFDAQAQGLARIIETLTSMNMAQRRRIFVLRLTRRFETMDAMAALHNNVNLLVNKKNLQDLTKILVHNKQEHNRFYAVYNTCLKETGKG